MGIRERLYHSPRALHGWSRFRGDEPITCEFEVPVGRVGKAGPRTTAYVGSGIERGLWSASLKVNETLTQVSSVESPFLSGGRRPGGYRG